MTYLILGLVIFLGVHSVRIFADGWRTHARASLGELPWKGLYSVLSLIGFGLIVWGFGLARQQPVQLWAPPVAIAVVEAHAAAQRRAMEIGRASCRERV